MEQKEESILLWKTGKYTITSLAEMFNISRPTVHKYIERYEKYGLLGLMELSRAPGKVPNKTPDRIEKEIIKIRKKHPRWGAAKLLILLEDEFPELDLPKLSTVSLILKRNGLVKERKKRHKVEPKKPILNSRFYSL